MNEILNDNFLIELFKLCLKKRETIEICQKVLKYQYLPNSGYKELWKQINREFTFTKNVPSIGVLFQNLKGKEETVEILEEIQKIDTPEEKQVIKTLEEFIKNQKCIEFYDNFQEIYVSGDRDKAIDLLNKTSEELSTFTLSSDYMFTSIFKDFYDRQYQNKIDKAMQDENFGFYQPVIGIDEMDLYFPIKPNTVTCSLAQSGVGKTTHLVSIGVENARRGAGVLFVAAEGTEEELEDRFDACWTATNKIRLEEADLEDDEIDKLAEIAEKVTSIGGEIELHLFTEFNTATVLDIYNLVCEYEKIHGKVPDVLIVDYLELFTVHNKQFSTGEEKARRQAVARALSNLVSNKKIGALFTATQASNVDTNLSNSDEFVLTRNDISGDKNLLDCFSLFYSLNQTVSELNDSTMRLYVDKSRHSSKVGKQIFRIATAYDKGNFYDRRRTIELFAPNLV